MFDKDYGYLNVRETGVLLHISSLSTEFGIGDFGPSAYRFARSLAQQDYNIWQILPINHCGYGNSPYNPVSAFSISPNLISPELLYQKGLIDLQTMNDAKLPGGNCVFYESVNKAKGIVLAKAAETWLQQNDVLAFIEANAYTLKPYLAFLALCKVYDDCAWYLWDEAHRSYSESLFWQLWKTNENYMKTCAASQAMLMDQVISFKAVLAENGLTLVGDMPLYLSYESADVWAHQALFDLEEQGNRLHLAGVPPDDFAAEGQLWGNPIYNWHAMQQDGFQLFIQRINHALAYLDKLRLDHFIGYVNYWQVDCDYDAQGMCQTPSNAKQGQWVPALPRQFFSRLVERFGNERFIAEDLGILNNDVCEIRDSFGFPGMIVLQFCFEDSIPKVHEYPADRWLYTGTHDNSTLRGWFEALPIDSASRRNLNDYYRQNK
ncbi:MAG: 4-alpha-glucanotransferase, partial [Candidatus Cloacimonetes bacterium]|nr:4-alpha-glucanotransferase [Candidatus Cloacimonadota bacterium]